MEKLKSIAKSIWAKIPKTKSEFKDLFDKCVSYYNENKAWFHRLGLGIAIALWGFILLAMLSNFFTLYFSGEETPIRASEVRLAVFTLAAWFSTPFLVWRTWIASKQANTAQEKAYTELFTQAVEQLGSVKPVGKDQYEVNIEVRIGALYALERIMKDSDKDAKTIIDTLATYVKQNCGDPKNFEEEITHKEVTELRENPPANRYDIQTALTIIGRRPEKYKTKETMPDLTKVNLQGVNLVRFDLSLCNLANAHLEGAKLQRADLVMAELQRADLQDVQITDAHKTAASVIWVDFTKAKYDFDTLQEQLPDMFGHKKLTKLPKDENGEDMEPPDHWSEADMDTDKGRKQYNRDWEAFKKEKGVG